MTTIKSRWEVCGVDEPELHAVVSCSDDPAWWPVSVLTRRDGHMTVDVFFLSRPTVLEISYARLPGETLFIDSVSFWDCTQ